MSASNHERVGKALENLRQGLAPFVRREMESVHGDGWQRQALSSLRHEGDYDSGDDVHLDVHALLVIIWHQWHEVFKNSLGHAERSLVSELREVRNAWAHQHAFSTDDAYRALDSGTRLLTAISAPEARQLEQMKQELLRVRYQEEARRQLHRAATNPIKGEPQTGLKPWREVVTPHPDVASGRYQQAEFAADMGQVHRGEGSSEYRDPQEFFERTFLTEGLRQLLRTSLLRLSRKGGDPVVELQTNFGGGKTHSMLALYHLFSGIPAATLTGIEDVLADTGLAQVPKAHRAVLVGTARSPAQPVQRPDGTVTHTLWGDMAWQLGGAEGYTLVAEADQQGVSPGSDALHQLFQQLAPCLILIDEWVRFVSQTYNKQNDLPCGSFDANISFAQALTEAARRSSDTLVVASIPASDIEMGGEGGREALARLKNIFSRVQTSWRPASTEEGFEIVRRRLFQPMDTPEKFKQRNAVAAAFGQLYRTQDPEFPPGCREKAYERRLQAAYPVHPELFDRLFGAWSSLERFQRTRGVLRLMAAVIHELWKCPDDRSPLIMPATLPLAIPSVHKELNNYLADRWQPVVEQDVDGPQSLPLLLDKEHPNLGRYSACRRVARTIFIGAAPTVGSQNPGIDDRSIRLGCVQPGESIAIFGDALRHLTSRATFLYTDGTRHWFDTQPSVTRVAQDRAAQQDEDSVWEEVQQRLRTQVGRGRFAGVHIAPETSGDVPDEAAVRLVVLDPRKPHTRQDGSPAWLAALDILLQRGSSPRQYRNMVVFLAADRARCRELEQAVRDYLAWKSIVDTQEDLNLNTYQRTQAQKNREEQDGVINRRIQETLCWLLVPTQPDPKKEPDLSELRVHAPNGDNLADRAGRRLEADSLLVTKLSGLLLRTKMDRYNLWQQGGHVSLKRLWEYFASYVYLPRLRDVQVFCEAVQHGVGQLTWKQETFAYAEAWDDKTGLYAGLKAGQAASVLFNASSVVVKAEVAQQQLEQKQATPEHSGVDAAAGGVPGPESGSGRGSTTQPQVRPKRRFHGLVSLDALTAHTAASTVANEIIQHLTGIQGAEVEVTLEIQASFPKGVSDDIRQVISENCRTLKFRTFGFEE